MFDFKADNIRKTGLFVYFILIYTYSAICLSVLRLVFLCRVYPDVFGSAESGNIFKAFLVGLRFDTSVISYSLLIIAVLLIAMYIYRLFREINNFIYTFLIISHIILLFIILLTQIVDIEYFRTFSSHLTFRDLVYLDSTEVYGTVLSDYPVFKYIVCLSVILILYCQA